MTHAILLGDSILDNGAYVPGGPDVVKQLRAKLPFQGKASLLAVDGAVTRGVLSQLSRVPGDATHLIVSAGGNDALGASGLLHQSVGTVTDAVSLLENAQSGFARDYSEMAKSVLAHGLPTAFCTIYDTPPSSPDQRIIRTALAIFNDIITRVVFESGATLIDLRLISNQDEDYANPIEPSSAGGEKISAAIARFVAGTSSGTRSTVIARA